MPYKIVADAILYSLLFRENERDNSHKLSSLIFSEEENISKCCLLQL